jgi:excisionase family DNA binding protein
MTAKQIRSACVEARREELLTVGEFARLVRCSEKTVYRRIWAGRQAGAVRVGREWRIDLVAAGLAVRPPACPIVSH